MEDNDYIFRRALDLQTNLPEMINHLKNDRRFRNMDKSKKKELLDRARLEMKKAMH